MKVWFSVFAGEMVPLECTEEQPEVFLKFTSVHEDQEDAIVRFYTSPDRSWPLVKADLPLISVGPGMPFCTMTATKIGSSMRITLEQIKGKNVSVFISFSTGSAVLTEIKESATSNRTDPQVQPFSPGEPKRPVLQHEKAVGERTSTDFRTQKNSVSARVSARVSTSHVDPSRKEAMATSSFSKRDTSSYRASEKTNSKAAIPVVIVLAIIIVGGIVFLNPGAFGGDSSPVAVVDGSINTVQTPLESASTESVLERAGTQASTDGAAVIGSKKYELVVYFNPESAAMTAQTIRSLQDFVDLRKNVKSVVITGHCALFDDESERLTLSNERAEAVAQWLKAYWVKAEFIIDGQGGKQPITKSPEQQSLNRRVVITATE